MLYWAVICLIIAVVAAIFGFGGISSTFASAARILFFIFIILFIGSFLIHLFA